MRGTQLIMRRELVIYLLFHGLTTGLCVTEFSKASFMWKAPPSRTPVLNLFGYLENYMIIYAYRIPNNLVKSLW